MKNLERLNKYVALQNECITNNDFKGANDLQKSIDFLITELTESELKTFIS